MYPGSVIVGGIACVKALVANDKASMNTSLELWDATNKVSLGVSGYRTGAANVGLHTVWDIPITGPVPAAEAVLELHAYNSGVVGHFLAETVMLLF